MLLQRVGEEIFEKLLWGGGGLAHLELGVTDRHWGTRLRKKSSEAQDSSKADSGWVGGEKSKGLLAGGDGEKKRAVRLTQRTPRERNLCTYRRGGDQADGVQSLGLARGQWGARKCGFAKRNPKVKPSGGFVW